MSLSIAEQIKLVNSLLTPAKRKALKSHLNHPSQTGGSFFGSIARGTSWLVKHVSPVITKVAPIVLERVIVPLLLKRAGLGLKTAGSGLSVPGAGKPKRKRAAKKK